MSHQPAQHRPVLAHGTHPTPTSPADAAAASVVALDVGGTTVKGARFGLDGAVLDDLELTTGSHRRAVEQVLHVLQALTDASTVAATVAVPGTVDLEAGVVRYSANLGWRGLALRELAADALGVPVALERDVRAAGRAEAVLGHGRGARSLFLVVIGTGVGSAIISEHRSVVGESGLAGEVGHMPVHPDGELCACGQHGCLETYASASALVRRFRARGGQHDCTAADIAVSDDPLARAVWEEATEALGLALASSTMLLDPAVIVLAGGLTQAGDRLLVPVREALERRLAWRPAPPVELSPLSTWAGRVGAAVVAWDLVGRADATVAWPPALPRTGAHR